MARETCNITINDGGSEYNASEPHDTSLTTLLGKWGIPAAGNQFLCRTNGGCQRAIDVGFTFKVNNDYEVEVSPRAVAKAN